MYKSTKLELVGAGHNHLSDVLNHPRLDVESQINDLHCEHWRVVLWKTFYKCKNPLAMQDSETGKTLMIGGVNEYDGEMGTIWMCPTKYAKDHKLEIVKSLYSMLDFVYSHPFKVFIVKEHIGHSIGQKMLLKHGFKPFQADNCGNMMYMKVNPNFKENK